MCIYNVYINLNIYAEATTFFLATAFLGSGTGTGAATVFLGVAVMTHLHSHAGPAIPGAPGAPGAPGSTSIRTLIPGARWAGVATDLWPEDE